MRVLQVHCRYREPGGEDMSVKAEADLLRSAGHEVIQYQVSNPEAAIPAAANLAFAAWNPKRIREIRRLAHDLRPDVAHVQNTWFSISPAVFRALHEEGLPTVATLRNYRLVCANASLFRQGRVCTDCLGRGPWRGVAHRCYRDSLVASFAAASTISLHRRLKTWTEVVDTLLVLTEFEKQVLVDAGMPSEKLVVHSNFGPDPGPRSVPPSASHTVLFVGRLSEEKGIRLLIDAWEQARPSDLELLVVGEGPLREQMEARRVPSATFVGHQPPRKVTDLMLSARALIFPSLWFEPQGRVVLEAAAAGLPVLATAGTAASEVAATAGEEWVCEATAGAVGKALKGLMTAPSLIDEASAAMRHKYEESFSPRSALGRLQSVLAEPRRPTEISRSLSCSDDSS